MSAIPSDGGLDHRFPARTVSVRPVRVAASRERAHRQPRVFMPQGYEPGYAYPLLVWLPGSRRFDLGKAMNRLSTRNYLAVEPVIGPEDRPAAIEDAVWEAIDAAAERANVHPDRVFLIGRGDGGTAAFRVGCRHADRFAGMVSLGGAFPHAEALFARLSAVRRLPVLLCCRRDAEADMVATTSMTLRLFHAAGAQLSMRIYQEPHDLAPAILRDVNRWLMDAVCGGVSVATPVCPA